MVNDFDIPRYHRYFIHHWLSKKKELNLPVSHSFDMSGHMWIQPVSLDSKV